MIELEVKNIGKAFAKSEILSKVNLKVNKGKFYTILGPSGSGKSTLLKIISGNEEQDYGQIYLKGVDISKKPTHKRNVGMVFQNLALFTHLNVYENLAFGLKAQKKKKEFIRQKILEGLKIISIDPSFLTRNVSTLSGGEQQRIALLRTTLVEPNVILLDEPLSNVDANLRASLRDEIKNFQRRLNITMIMVTHDKEDAYAISDKIAILYEKKIQQIGSPEEIYESPCNHKIANFLNSHQLLDGQLEFVINGIAKIRLAKGVYIYSSFFNNLNLKKGELVTIGIKSERFFLNLESFKENNYKNIIAEIVDFQILGPLIKYKLSIENCFILEVLEKNIGIKFKQKEEVRITYDPKNVIIFQKNKGEHK